MTGRHVSLILLDSTINYHPIHYTVVNVGLKLSYETVSYVVIKNPTLGRVLQFQTWKSAKRHLFFVVSNTLYFKCVVDR